MNVRRIVILCLGAAGLLLVVMLAFGVCFEKEIVMNIRVSAIIRIVCWSVAALLLISALTFGLAFRGEFVGFGAWFGDYREVKSATEDVTGVTDIEVDLVSGDVNIFLSEDETMHYTEYARRDGEEYRLTVTVNDNTLKIRQPRQRWDFFSWGSESCRIDVYLPAKQWQLLKVKTTSGDIRVQVEADRVQLSSVSGDVHMTDGIARDLTVNTTSGDVKVALETEADVDSLILKSVSGDVNFSGKVSGGVRVNTVSGSMRMNLDACPKTLQAHTTSGDIAVSVPANSEFVAEYNTVSGDFRCGLSGVTEGKRFTCGDGSGQFDLKTVSGDIRIN